MDLECKKIINRRKFLEGSVILGITALTQRLLGRMAPLARAADARQIPTPPAIPSGTAADDLNHHIYLPFVSRQEPPAHGPSKLGLHTLNPNNAVGFAQAVHDAGAHVALVKALNNFGYLRLVKEISPETVTVARSSVVEAVDRSGDPAETAARAMNRHVPKWEWEKDVVDYWEILNENAPPTIGGHVWLAQFFIEAMNIADANENEYKLALFSYSTGVPQWHHWEAIVETGVFARAKEGGHVLALHEYDWPVMNQRWGEPTEDLPPYEDRGVLAGRYRYLYRDFLIPRDEVIPLVITECGLDPVVGGPDLEQPWQERYVKEMAWYDTRLREDDYVVGAAMFSVGTFKQWVRYDYEELLGLTSNPYGPDNFLDYIVSLKDA
jgi:hypothetical protein